MADNTRKTSNIIHDLDKVKEDVSNNSQDITNLSQDLTTLDGEAVKKINGVAPNSDGNITLVEGDNIDIVENTSNNNLTIKANLSEYTPTADLPAVNDKAINLSASKGVKVTQDGNTTGNNQSDKEWKLEANYTDIKDNINLALNDLSDVSNTSASANQVLTYNGSMWTAANSTGGGNVTGGVTSLNGEEGSINITSANQTIDVAVDNSANPTTINLELNGTIPSVPSNIVETINNLDGNLTLQSSDSTIGIAANGTDKINLTLNASLNDLNNVSTGTPSDNQVLTWDGSNWTSQNASGGTFKTINDTIPDASGNFNIINGTGINATAGTNNLTLDCTVKNTDTGILTLTDGTSTVPTSGRSVEFTSSDASVQYTLDGNKIDLTVPAAGLNIKGSVQYAEPQTEADGTYTDGDGNAHEVLWLPSQYLEAASGVDNPALGDLWIVQYEGSAADGPPPGTSPYGHGYVFSLKGDNSGDYEWVDAGRLQGPPGEDGTDISLEENVTVNSNSTISSSTGEFVENASAPGEYALTLNIAPSDVNADCVKSLNGLNEAINITSSDSFLKISNNDSVNPKTIDLTLQSVVDGGQNLALKTDIKDGNINMTASNGVKMSTGSANATANQSTNTEFKIEANYTEIAGNIAVGNLSNVCDTDPKDKQVLAWDNANTTWCPANATAAAALPITDTRDPATVKLDSPSANTFSISIGASQRVLVDADSSDFEGTIRCNNFLSTVDTDPAEIQLTSNIVFDCLKLTRFNANGTTVAEVNGESFGVGINTVATDKAGLTVKTKVVNPTYGTQGVWSNGSVSANTDPDRYFDSFLSQPIIAAASGCEVIHFRAFDNAASTTTGSHAGFVAGNLKAGTTKNYGFWSQVALEAGKTNYAFYASSTAPSYFNGDVITTRIRGKDNGLGSVVIADDVVIDGTTVIMEVGSLGREEKNIDFASNETGVAGGDGVYILSRTNDIALSSDEIRFNSDWSGGATEPTWVMTQDSGFVGNNNFNYIKCGSISGTISDDASISFGTNFTINVFDQELLFGGYGADYSGGTICGLGASSNYIWSKAASGFAIASDRIAFNSNASGGAVGCDWSMETDGTFVGATGAGIEANVISAGRNNTGDSSVELGADFAFSTNGQATLKQNDGSAYTATASDSLMTRQNVEDILTGSGGNDDGQLPGSGSSYIWQKVQIWQPAEIDGENQTLENYQLLFGCDGVFTDGVHWTTDGENWKTVNSSIRDGLFNDYSLGDRVVKSYAENLYWCDNYFSYDMKNWNTSNFPGLLPFYFDGHIFEAFGTFYFDPTGPARVATAGLYGKSPELSEDISTLNQYHLPATGEPTGSIAFRVGYDIRKTQNVLLQLKKDEIGNADWGWNTIDLPGDDEPFNVLFTDGDGPKFYVFCSQKVYVSSTADSTNFTAYDLPVSSNWDLVCYDGVSITAASSTSDLSIFSRDDGATWKKSDNFQNSNMGVSFGSLAGTNGRTIYSYSTGSATETDETTGVVTEYSIYQYLRSGVGTIGDDETLIIGGGVLAQTGSVYLAEPVDTEEQNGWWNLGPTIRLFSTDASEMPPEPAIIRTQEQANSLFSNKIYQLSHEKPNVEVLTQAEYDAIPADELDENTLYLIT